VQGQDPLDLAVLLYSINVNDSVGSIRVFNNDPSANFASIVLAVLLLLILFLPLNEAALSVIEVAGFQLGHHLFDALFLANLIDYNVPLSSTLLNHIKVLVARLVAQVR
jgi:hypothetical protein